ncbi:hypothetical protein AQUCO_01300911v1 [Aquilegia coerulea]|uniref:KIB1-4 beta-propeller domain-containing protein n=1 Tax=Aquilegia coerulea TaxID=218851 RepID=A0A2G5E444_AQUCA|nr:hypothetical protein AQUCO_01300911v1 [Aquilegia coerulea]PIA50500.1 hypothetical protein AQUCO_01300911v1 [Aquilegia coerulea]
MDEGRVVNWLDLPSQLMDLISEKLMIHITEFIRFGAVCHSWHSIYTQNRNRLPRQLPGLLLFTEPQPPTQQQYQDQDQDRRQRRSHAFYDFTEKRVYKFPLQLPPHTDCHGSNQGWLIYEKESQLFLLNPFLSVDNEIHLPPLTTFILNEYESVEYYEFGNGQSFIHKAILCGNPASSSNYLVVATDAYSSMLAFYKSGDKEWTSIITDEFEYIEDFIYYKDQLYVLDGHRGLFACDISSDPKVSKVAPPIGQVYAYDLVESSGELLAVKKSNVGFEAYKLDQNLLDWVEIKSLSGGSLFIGANFSLSRLCSNYPGWEPNSVYMTIPRSTIVANRAEVVRVYKLEVGNIESLYLTESNPTVYSTAIWIEPTLRGCPN